MVACDEEVALMAIDAEDLVEIDVDQRLGQRRTNGGSSNSDDSTNGSEDMSIEYGTTYDGDDESDTSLSAFDMDYCHVVVWNKKVDVPDVVVCRTNSTHDGAIRYDMAGEHNGD